MQTIPVLGGRYRLGPVIASGGMGAVHRAWDERFGREVAIKVVRSGADRVERERLRREAQYLAHLDQPNLVAVLDAGEDRLRTGDTVWFAMELVAGPDLRTLLRRDGALDGAATRRVLAGVLAALEALHAAGVVHRDLKPANVLLTAEPTTDRWDVKLIDLGIAHLTRTDHLTSTGQIVGTAAYLSPEQVQGRAIGPATDVYALGLLVLEALTGRIAFPGGPAESAAARLVRSPDLPSALDPAWRTVLTAMTELDPAARPTVATLRGLVHALPSAALRADAHLDRTELLPMVPAADAATAVLAAPSLVTTGAVAAPAPSRWRKHALAAACLLAVVAAAAGWTAALAGSGQPASAAGTSPAAVAPARSAAPKPTRTATETPTPTPTTTTPPVVETSQSPVETPSTTVADRTKQIEKSIERWRQKLRGHDRKHWSND